MADECIVCVSTAINTVNTGCGHRCLCVACALVENHDYQQFSCPVCRQKSPLIKTFNVSGQNEKIHPGEDQLYPPFHFSNNINNGPIKNPEDSYLLARYFGVCLIMIFAPNLLLFGYFWSEGIGGYNTFGLLCHLFWTLYTIFAMPDSMNITLGEKAILLRRIECLVNALLYLCFFGFFGMINLTYLYK